MTDTLEAAAVKPSAVATPCAWLGGEIVPLAEAKIGVTDIGVLRGFGIYEGLVTHNRKPFMLTDHFARLRRSAEKIGLTVPKSDEAIAAGIAELVERNTPGGEALIRIILTGGPAVGVIEYDPATPTLFMLADPFVPLEEKYLENGCAVSVVDYRRELAEIKSINYIRAVMLQKLRKEEGTLEVVYTHDGQLFEAAGSNVFVVKNGTLITPKDGIVYGITRKAVIDLAKNAFPLEERPVTVEEMYGADELFITGSFKEVVPVSRAGDRQIGDGRPGPVTKKIIELFREFTRNY